MSIQSEIDAKAASGGGDVIVPAGRQVLTSQIRVRKGVRLIGTGKVGYDYHTTGISGGTIFDIQWGSGPGTSGNVGYAAFVLESGASIENIGFDYSLQNVNAGSPTEYGSTIQTRDPYYNDYSISIKDCYFFRSYIAIDSRASKGSTGCSNLFIQGCVGSPIYAGIAIDGVTDWQTISDCHFNSGFLNATKNGLVAWALANGNGLLIGGNDWLQCNNVQVFGYGNGASITGQLGYAGSGPYSFNFCQFDGCRTGIGLAGTIWHPVQVNNCKFAPYDWFSNAQGAALSGNGANINGIQFTNNYVFSSPLFGVWLGNGQIRNVQISGNNIQTSGSPGCGITVIGANNVQINNNIIQGFGGLTYTVGSSNVILRDNQG